jgi:hypothetical protein
MAIIISHKHVLELSVDVIRLYNLVATVFQHVCKKSVVHTRQIIRAKVMIYNMFYKH